MSPPTTTAALPWGHRSVIGLVSPAAEPRIYALIGAALMSDSPILRDMATDLNDFLRGVSR